MIYYVRKFKSLRRFFYEKNVKKAELRYTGGSYTSAKTKHEVCGYGSLQINMQAGG